MGMKRDKNAPSTHESRTTAAEVAIEHAFGAEKLTPNELSGLDELDEAILHHLERHGRATNYEVGEAVGLSASAASRRIQALETAGAIRGYQARINDQLLGKRMTVFIRVTLERQSAPVLGAFEAAIRKSKNIVSCHLMAGQYDYMLVVRVAGIDDYGRLHQNELSRLPGVTRLETSFALRDVLEGKA
jgi:Lrp/AsnC family transcriptional regulator, leucine-responsive regulatory protein